MILAASTASSGGPCNLPVVSAVCNAAGNAVAGAAKGAAQTFVDGFADGFATCVKTMMTFWVKVPTPQLSSSAGPVAHIESLVYWAQGAILVASLIYVGGRMALDRSGEYAGEAGKRLALMVLVNGAGAATIDLLVIAGDAWSQWIIEQSAGGDMATRLGALTGGSAAMTGLGIGLEFLIALLGTLSALAQIFLLLARAGVLVLLVGSLPLTTAGMATEAGRAAFLRIVGWIIAFVVYKPAAALIYATAFMLSGTGKDLVSVLSALMLMILAVFALPALQRLVAPMVAAASAGSGGGLTGAVAGAALASGARQVSDRGSDGGGDSGSGSAPHLLKGSSSGSGSQVASGMGSSAEGAGGAAAGGAEGGAAAGAEGAGAAGGAGAGVGGAIVAGGVKTATLTKTAYDQDKAMAQPVADEATGEA